MIAVERGDAGGSANAYPKTSAWNAINIVKQSFYNTADERFKEVKSFGFISAHKKLTQTFGISYLNCLSLFVILHLSIVNSDRVEAA